MLVSNYALKLETDVLKGTGDLAGKDTLCGYNTKGDERQHKRVFNHRLRTAFLPPTKVPKKPHLRDAVFISTTVYIWIEHFRAMGGTLQPYTGGLLKV